MKELPYIEEIYDFETEQLETLLTQIDNLLLQGASGNQSQIELPKGFESFDKFERKALKLKESLELELEERRQVDDVISFFVNQNGSSGSGGIFGNNDLLNDDKFYQPMSNPQMSQNKNSNENIDQIMQRQKNQDTNNTSQIQQQQMSQNLLLNQQNLNKLTGTQSQQQQNNTTRDDKLETDTNFSQYMKQTNDDTQSQYTENTSQHKMFSANRGAQKGNKKQDIGAFMREKLAKTKIASESMGVIQQSIAINPNNFAKKKKLDDDSKSVSNISSSQQSTSVDNKQTIYKPNLKRKQSTTASSVKTGITATTKISSNMVSGVVMGGGANVARKSSASRGGAATSSVTIKQQTKDQDNEQKKTKPSVTAAASKQKDKESGKSSTTQSIKENQNATSSSIYKPSNMSSSTATGKSRVSNKPPTVPIKDISDKTKQQKVASDNKTEDNQLNNWQDGGDNNDVDVDDQQQLLGQEEIESKYDDNDIDDENAGEFNKPQTHQDANTMNNYVINVDEDEVDQQQQRDSDNDGGDNSGQSNDQKFKVSDLLGQVEVTNPQKQRKDLINKANHEVFSANNNTDDEEEKVGGYDEDNGDEEDDDDNQDFYKPISNSDIKPRKQSNTQISTNNFNQDQDHLRKIFDYEDNNNNDSNDNSNVLRSQQLQSNNQQEQLIDTNIVKINQLNIQTEPSSTTSKKIRGKVQIFVDDSVINNSVQQTPSNNNIQSSTQNIVQNQLKMLEDQDKELDNPIQQQSQNNNNKPAGNKRMEQLKQLMNQTDDQKRKQEQDERLKQIRDQIQKEKETAVVKITATNANIDDKESDKTTKKEETNVKQNNVEENKKSAQQQTNKKQIGAKTKAQSNKKDDKQIVSKIPRQPDGHDQYIDYSGHYKTFYEIFVGQLIEPKTFDVSFVIRDTRNTYAAFVNIMDSTSVGMKRKFQFEQAPLEKSLQDYYKALPDFFTLTGKNVLELEQEMKNRGNHIMMQAMAQQQLKNNFDLLKNKDVNDIVKEAQEKAAQSAQNSGANNSSQNQLVDENRESSLYYRVVKNRTEVYDIISRAFSRKSKWNELPHGLDLRNTWNLMWTWSKIKIDITKLIVWQKCNHFSGAKNVSRKDFLKRNIERAQKMSAKAGQVFNMLPLTFILPKEYVGFLESFSEFEDKEGKYNYWIMKPAAKSRGRGISLVNDLTQITYGEPIVVQRYIKNPLLINGYKFDMRIYVVVTSVNPLEVFLYKEGFGRFSTMPFSLDPTDRANKYIHLTNVSIQKYNVNSASEQSQDCPTDQLYGGTKISIQTCKKRVQQAVNVSWDDIIWPQIRDVVLKSLVACQNDIQFNPCCFELFGFDILIDSDYKCWLIEINSSPSLARETLLDDMIKQKLIDDIVDLVDPVDFDRKRLFEVLERRINEDFKQSTTSNAYSKRLMNRDLTYILNGKLPRRYGEMPKQMGNFERIAPSPACDQYLKLIGGQKMFGSMMKMQGENTNQPTKQ